jgi:hypothetical protein
MMLDLRLSGRMLECKCQTNVWAKIKEGNQEGNCIGFLNNRLNVFPLNRALIVGATSLNWLQPRPEQRYINGGHRPHMGSNDSHVRHPTLIFSNIDDQFWVLHWVEVLPLVFL